MARLRMAVIGVGHLGKEHARIVSTLPGAELVGVADANADQAKTIAKKCNTRAFTDYRELLPLVEAAVIAVVAVATRAMAGGVSGVCAGSMEVASAITAQLVPAAEIQPSRPWGKPLSIGGWNG